MDRNEPISNEKLPSLPFWKCRKCNWINTGNRECGCIGCGVLKRLGIYNGMQN